MEQPVYRLEKLNFNGPLDLLLHLLEKNKVDIYDIPISEITVQYMEYVQQLEEDDLEIVSDFLVMAATLLEIKAKMLLPKEKTEEEEEADPRAELVARLLEYKRFKYIAEELCGYEDRASFFLYGGEQIPEEVKNYIPPVDLDALFGGVTLSDLQRVFREVMARREEKVDRVRSNFGVIRRDRVSLSARIGSVLRYTRKYRRYSFREMLSEAHERMDVVVTFLAILELMKMGKIEVTQSSAFADIEVQATDTADTEEGLDLSSIEDN
ncbi:MAG: segregation/condensation protein A [Eubacteriales bacterium]|nr:segregation/condensation protein A [Eubacteriales bacterium]